jgi:GTPase SAR1 family protein
MYYRNARAAVVVFDLTSQASFHGSEAWVQELQSTVEDIFIVLCGNKSDLDKRRVVQPDQAMGLAQQLELAYIETSAKTGVGLEDLFQILAKAVINARAGEIETMADRAKTGNATANQGGCC